MAGHVIIPKEIHVQPPNLHLLGELFLPCCMRQTFDVVLLIQLYVFQYPHVFYNIKIFLSSIAMLISYALAGSEAYAQVIGVE